MSSILSALISIPLALLVMMAALVAIFMTIPVLFRLINEVTARTIAKTLTICPHCGMPGVIDSTHPKVFR